MSDQHPRYDDIPILQFDPAREAIIEPAKILKRRDLPERCVLTFFREVIERVKDEFSFELLPPLISEMGETPVYAGVLNDTRFGVVPASVGAPLAAGHLEELIARGGREFVVCGGAGVLDPDIGSGDIIVPTSALRDEGTSYHYLPPGRDAFPSEESVRTIVSILEAHGCHYVTGKTWTTDAFYRETPDRVSRRKRDGCIAVEMEAAAYFAVAEFRRVRIGQLLYGGDDVSGVEWDRRGFGDKIPAREMLFRLSVEACLACSR